MAEEKQTVADEEPVKATKETAEAKKPKAKEYTIEHLSKYCRSVFGVSSYAFAGATASLDHSKTYTKEYIEDQIKKWNKKGVK